MGDSLRYSCASINVHQLKDSPAMVTGMCSLLDVVMVSNKAIITASGFLDLAVSDHYLVRVFLDMKVPIHLPPTSQPGVSKTIPLTRFLVTSPNTIVDCGINGLSG